MPTPSSAAFFALFSRVAAVFLGCFAVCLLSVAPFFVRILTGLGRSAQKARALIAAGHTITAVITGVREERGTRRVGQFTMCASDSVFRAIRPNPRTSQDVTFARRSVTRGRYAPPAVP